ncbi:hypothetical protein [Pseudoroseicyclus tamaricis]|uniref:Transferrin-binding protein B C-lobe/N-lobe beta barrel domain-containing protein n=1 Tax=Pseudoroseicyclus tamaricis TaxID=2705421 RepID=A0A6B2JGW4_9RHOB|nr:hypothetical protein [Pseudoroseicyclus tamaricis]NDV00461.1 hypothetical protein [Pseudoroseicyclus tamaricis]
MRLTAYAFLAVPLVAAACSATGVGTPTPNNPVPVDPAPADPSPYVPGPIFDLEAPTNSASFYGPEAATDFEIFNYRNEAQEVATSLPAYGTANYDGSFASIIDSSGDYSTLFGDVDLDVNFGTKDVTGSFHNLGARKSELEYFDVNGELYVAGDLSGAGIDADVAGVLESGVDVYYVDAALAAELTENGNSMLGIIGGSFYDEDDNEIPLGGVMHAD